MLVHHKGLQKRNGHPPGMENKIGIKKELPLESTSQRLIRHIHFQSSSRYTIDKNWIDTITYYSNIAHFGIFTST